MIKCQDYNQDVSSGNHTFDLKEMFKSQLSSVDRILMITHPKRDYKVVPDLSKQPSQMVSFHQNLKIDSNTALLTYSFKNLQRIDGRICVLAQGKGLSGVST